MDHQLQGRDGGGDNSPSVLGCVESLDTYAGHSAHFPSLESLRWFIRINRSALVAAGALLSIRGRVMLDVPRFERVVLDVGRAAAAQGPRDRSPMPA